MQTLRLALLCFISYYTLVAQTGAINVVSGVVDLTQIEARVTTQTANDNSTKAASTAYVDASSGGKVSNVTATAPLTSSGGATPNISATYQGNGLKIQASTGTTTTNDCVKFDVNGNTVDAGAACATAVTSNQNLRTVGVTFTGNGSALSGTATDCQEVTSSGIINAVYTIADISGSITVDIRTVAFGSYTGTAGFSGYTSIVAAAAPSLSSVVKYTDSTLTGWSTTLTAGTMFCVQASSPTTVTNVKVKVLYAAN